MRRTSWYIDAGMKGLCATIVLSCCVTSVFADNFGAGNNGFELEFALIGNPNNQPGMTHNGPAGSVGYLFQITKYEISRDIVEKANAEGALGITLASMDYYDNSPRPNMPATGASWNEAARFVNWLNTSQGHPAAYKFSAQPGDLGYDPSSNIELWEPTDQGYDANNRFRNSNAFYFVPSADEWFKAAYYDPDANGGEGEYWDYPVGSDSIPARVASGTDPNSAVFLQLSKHGPADVTQAGGLSPYGVMGMGGNVWEMIESLWYRRNDNPSYGRGLRGAAWDEQPGRMAAINQTANDAGPTQKYPDHGFRVASIPEPESLWLAGTGIALVAMWARRQERKCDVNGAPFPQA